MAQNRERKGRVPRSVFRRFSQMGERFNVSAFRDITRGFSKSDSGSVQDIPEIEKPGSFNPVLNTGSASAPASTPSSASSARDMASQKASEPVDRPDVASPSHKAQRASSASKKRRATDKELQRLRRVDLLELLVDQIKDNDRLTAENDQLSDLSERLKAKLDEKDAQIEHLKQRLNMKDDQIKRLEDRNRAFAHASGTLDVSELVAIEEQAIDRYLQRLQAQGVIPSADPRAQSPHGTYTR